MHPVFHKLALSCLLHHDILHPFIFVNDMYKKYHMGSNITYNKTYVTFEPEKSGIEEKNTPVIKLKIETSLHQKFSELKRESFPEISPLIDLLFFSTLGDNFSTLRGFITPTVVVGFQAPVFPPEKNPGRET